MPTSVFYTTTCYRQAAELSETIVPLAARGDAASDDNITQGSDEISMCQGARDSACECALSPLLPSPHFPFFPPFLRLLVLTHLLLVVYARLPPS